MVNAAYITSQLSMFRSFLETYDYRYNPENPQNILEPSIVFFPWFSAKKISSSKTVFVATTLLAWRSRRLPCRRTTNRRTPWRELGSEEPVARPQGHDGGLLGSMVPWGYPKLAGWFLKENRIQTWMIQGYPYFRKPPFNDLTVVIMIIQRIIQ